MNLLFYTIFLWAYRLAIRIAAFKNQKAKQWLAGRKDIFSRVEQKISPSDKIIWFHCASLGEFEQGRPVIEKIRIQYPGYKILLTFFSPSGYEIRKNYTGADFIFYLPMDSSTNAQRFLDIVHPSLVVFVKYEYWYYYLRNIRNRNIPLLLISAVYRSDQPFFKWWGSFYRKMLACFMHIFVQDKQSATQLKTIDFQTASLAGDTRFDRVVEIAGQFDPIEIIEEFCSDHKIIIAGSTWPDDEKMLKNLSEQIDRNVLKFIIAPHEINKAHIDEIQRLFPEAMLYSQLTTQNQTSNLLSAFNNNVLIIDTIGILSRLYKYAYITYIGGGFTRDGIHNSLEAAVYGKPVLFGPTYSKYREAVELIDAGGAKSFATTEELKDIVEGMLRDIQLYNSFCNASKGYVQSNAGATKRILEFIQENRLLTN
ncbi:MAG: glycosyltransferase N-terminal domain-containing protein [Chitinophagaceae bacterium]